MLKCSFVASILLLMAGVASASPQRTEIDVNDHDGAVVAKIVICNDCSVGGAPGDGPCRAGAEEGWRGQEKCGSCLLRKNWGVRIEYAHDLQIDGKLVDDAGAPVVGRFVKMFLPNGVGVRTRTVSDGSFRMMLGATSARKSHEPIRLDLGTWVDSVSSDDSHFALYMLPKEYEHCSSDEGEPPVRPEIRPL